jgi:type VI secretion system protein ImpG
LRDELLPHYERELSFIRQMASEFADKYPGVTGGLMLRGGVSEDPHVERLIEAFALLCGRVHHKLDDDFPQITEALLDSLYPHYLQPVPSQAIAQFQSDAAESTPARLQVPAGVSLHSNDEGGDFCSFRTCYPVDVWPLSVESASVSLIDPFTSRVFVRDASAVLRIRLRCAPGLKLAQIPIGSLRFYLNGEPAAAAALYEFLFVHALAVSIRGVGETDPSGGPEAILPSDSLRPVGFSPDEAVLPYSDRSFPGYRLLQEYFSFPEKFLFVDIMGLDRIAKADFGSVFEIAVALKNPEDKHALQALEQTVSNATFQLGCTPVINLFERLAEPIRLEHTKYEYRVIPDQHRLSSTEVYSIDEVVSTGGNDGRPRVYEPFYSIRHATQSDEQKTFWHAHRRPSNRKNDKGTEVYLTLVDTELNPALPATEVLSVRVTCTNREQAGKLRFSGKPGEFGVEGIASVRARCVTNPTFPVRPPHRGGLQWRLISHLSLNHLSIVEKGKDALQEILRLYDFSGDPAIRRQIAGIIEVSSAPSFARIASPAGLAFCRGTDVVIDFDEQQYVGASVMLLANVLERFLALYGAVNSFTRFTAKTRKGVLKQWSPRAGEQILL